MLQLLLNTVQPQTFFKGLGQIKHKKHFARHLNWPYVTFPFLFISSGCQSFWPRFRRSLSSRIRHQCQFYGRIHQVRRWRHHLSEQEWRRGSNTRQASVLWWRPGWRACDWFLARTHGLLLWWRGIQKEFVQHQLLQESCLPNDVWWRRGANSRFPPDSSDSMHVRIASDGDSEDVEPAWTLYDWNFSEVKQ